MLLDSARFDSLASADRRLLYASGAQLSDDESDCYEEIEDDGDVESCEVLEYKRNNFFYQEQIISFERSSRYPRKLRGLFAIQQSKSGPDGILRRQNASDRSNRSREDIACSSSLSNRSASLRIIWEGQQNWDDEFAVTDETGRRPSIISRTPFSQQKIAPSTSAGDLGSVFDDVLSLSSAVDHSDEVPYEDVIECDDTNHNDIMRMKCMIDSKYMYQSVVVASSEVGSDNGGSVISSRSNLKELSKRLTRTMGPKGLWDLSHEVPSTSRLKTDRCEMTDSGFSRSTHSKRSLGNVLISGRRLLNKILMGRNHEPRSMFDSAIGGEMFSSEDESNDQFDRRILNPLRESDSSSHMSLEWCDEGLRQRESILEIDSRFMFGNVDIDCDSNRGSIAKSSKSPPSNICMLYRPKDSRDLMVYACEKFQPYSPQFRGMLPSSVFMVLYKSKLYGNAQSSGYRA
ncbi:hypothetical protein DICVIV_07999 [Dictyocaulus viviparus]|uniref:Uncharacterized protein n=1 Tax=Dictyocaulus viviparus TaxID=29172 RepID=A0A0D8XQ85_DICVI|nr:hypothetical protein DICVIV_07999 [Dictyocaulus viviparus]